MLISLRMMQNVRFFCSAGADCNIRVDGTSVYTPFMGVGGFDKLSDSSSAPPVSNDANLTLALVWAAAAAALLGVAVVV